MELYEIIGLRGIKEEAKEEFFKLAKINNPPNEIVEIRNGYSNPLTVAKIVNARLRCYFESIGGQG